MKNVSFSYPYIFVTREGTIGNIGDFYTGVVVQTVNPEKWITYYKAGEKVFFRQPFESAFVLDGQTGFLLKEEAIIGTYES